MSVGRLRRGLSELAVQVGLFSVAIWGRCGGGERLRPVVTPAVGWGVAGLGSRHVPVRRSWL